MYCCVSQSQHYTLVDKDGATSYSWEFGTVGNYATTTEFTEREQLTASEYVAANNFNYSQSSQTRGQSALLIERRMTFVHEVLKWEEAYLQEHTLRRDEIGPEHEQSWPPALWEARTILGTTDRRICSAFLNVAKRFPFIMRLNDDRRGGRPVSTIPVVKLPATYMCRIQSVIDGFIAGA